MEAKLGLVALLVLKASRKTSLAAASASSAGVTLGRRPQAPRASARRVSAPMRSTLGAAPAGRGGTVAPRLTTSGLPQSMAQVRLPFLVRRTSSWRSTSRLDQRERLTTTSGPAGQAVRDVGAVQTSVGAAPAE